MKVITLQNGKQQEAALNVTYLELTSQLQNWLKAQGFMSQDDLIIPHQLLSNNYAVIDKYGVPHWVVEIPRKNWDAPSVFAASIIHPAFMVNGVQRRIFIGKHQIAQASVGGTTRYVTWANQAVKHTINFDNLDTAINDLNNGTTITGFHMLTNAEWALVALLCKARALVPYGNNDYGRDTDDKSITGVFESGSAAVFGASGDARWLTGSGGHLTSHDRTAAGIFDLNGNVYEWVRGMRLNVGEIQILENNNAADYTKSVAAGSAEWKAILQDGSLVAPGTALTLKFDATGTGASGDVGDAKINTAITNDTGSTAYTYNTFEAITAEGGVTVPTLLKSLALYPYTTGLGGDGFYMRNAGERIPFRGGGWNAGSSAGVFYLDLSLSRTSAYTSFGGRLAFVL